MKTLNRLVLTVALASTLLTLAVGCSESGQAAEEARTEAAAARANVADANARVTAADAHVRAADADARVAALSDRRTESVPSPRVRTVIPSGTVLKVALIDAIDSDRSQPGDRFLASLAEAVVIDGTTLLPKGTKVRGLVSHAEGAGRVQGKGTVSLELTDITPRNSQMIAITTAPLVATAESTQTQDAAVVAGGAGLGAVIGAVAGGKKGAAIGAITGGGAGTGVVLATKGKDVHYAPETHLNFTLTSSTAL